MRPWRLILDTAHGAAENMAIDEAMMLSCANGSAPPTLRVYSWLRPSISLGCLQPLGGGRFDIDYCHAQGIDVVRRITGGRAVIHGSDVTFSIALRESDLPEGCSSVLASHRWLMGGIVLGLKQLGIDAEIGDSDIGSFRVPRSAVRNPVADCFAHIAECDVRVGTKKAVGSAQVRRSGAILEQGSVPYAAPGFDARRVFGRAGRLVAGDDLPLSGLTYQAIEQALAMGFVELVGGSLIPGEPSPEEWRLAQELAASKYSTEDWTLRQNLSDAVELVKGVA